MKNIPVLILVMAFVLHPEVLTACPLCQGGQGVSQQTIAAYKGITLLLALLPVVGAGGIFYWIYNKYKRFEQ
ncbi:MAG: hypothetical protein U0Y96_06080 [Candidatus Kapaibacterium sp.]|nr:hypothetical protein [Bacteroidota bacterium]